MKKLIAGLGLMAAMGCMSAPASATVYYIADCQAGAASGCVAGNDSNTGTSASTPWRTTGKLQSAFNVARPGDQFLLAKGGAWSGVNMTLYNTNGGNAAAMFDNPIVVDSYTPPWGAGTAKPILNAAAGENVFLVPWAQAGQCGG